VLGYKEEGLILSKKEGGEWMLRQLAAGDQIGEESGFTKLIRDALEEYATGQKPELQETVAKQFAEEMLGRIKDR
jgi:streptomycin 3"-adenylyltransferase